MEKLMKTINRYRNGEMFIIKWTNGFKIEAALDTLCETKNGLEEDEPGYKESFARVFHIKKNGNQNFVYIVKGIKGIVF